VLELEDLGFLQRLEPVHRLGAGDGFERSPVAEVGGHGAPLVAERGDEPETGD
jgi:hypothetical protein